MNTSPPENRDAAAEAALVTAAARDRNHRVMARVVDDSIARAAHLRELREARDIERRREEERLRRAEEHERLEKEDAARASQHRQAQEARALERDIERRTQRLDAMTRRDDTAGPFEFIA